MIDIYENKFDNEIFDIKLTDKYEMLSNIKKKCEYSSSQKIFNKLLIDI